LNRWLAAAFVLLMLGLTALFAALGVWQLDRLGEKERLIAAVADGLAGMPVPLAEATDYRPVTVAGRYVAASTVLVFTSLADTGASASGPGYWVMTALALDEGGSVYVNRGFVQQPLGAQYLAISPPEGTQSLSGIARLGEARSAFTPAADLAARIDWIRDPQRLAAFATDLPQPLSRFYIDLPAGRPGDLPLGGQTVVEFPNNHLGYAITWLGFAVLTPILLAFWVFTQRKKKVLP